MPGFNGSGTFVRTHNWVADRNALIKIVADRHDAEDDAFATGLSSCIVKDGQTTTTARIPFAAGIGVADGTVALPGINFTGDPNSGIYRISGDNIGVGVNATKILDIATTGLTVTGVLSASGVLTVTSNSASALAVGRLGATTPALKINAATSTCITGIEIVAAASGGGVAVKAIGETNVALTLDSAGSGTITIAGTSTGAITLARATTVSGVLGIADGTVGAPGIAFSGDLDNGAYKIGTNNWGLTAGGAKIIDIGTAGVAITGTLASSGALTVSAGGAAITGNSTVTGTFGVSSHFAVNTTDFVVTAGTGAVAFPGNLTINTNKFTVAAASGNTVIAGTLGATGDFAINTSSFTVTASNGNTLVAGTLTTGGTISINSSTITLNASTGAITTTGILLPAAGTNSAPSHSFSGDSNTGMYSGGADIIAFTAGGTARATISTTAIAPASDNAMTIGATSLGFSAAYLASSAPLRWGSDAAAGDLRCIVSQSLADDATVTIPMIGGFVWIADNESGGGLFFYNATAAFEIYDKDATYLTTDTDGSHCVFKSGANLVLRNRRGGARSYRIWHMVYV